ncbi:hypothetical protein F5X96DRAFT_614523 [Biscogniauxia mediterranea]|nr:hypothetical protein F5X96DRAFT_614523 [Biscogniauxia mediterranea]
MSLGVKLLWRAQSCTRCVKGLSLIPRESHSRLFLHQPTTSPRWLSTSRGVSKPSPGASLAQAAEATSLDEDAADLDTKLPSPLRRQILRQMIKTKPQLGPAQSALIEREKQYPTKHKSLGSLRKHKKSEARQILHDRSRKAREAQNTALPSHDWRATMDFMLRHTPKFGEALEFKVVIGKGAAEDAREVLLGPDMSLRHICRKHSCDIRVEDTSQHDDDVLVLSLSGPEVSLRKAMLELVRLVGKLTAVRSLDAAGETLLSDVWEGPSPIRLPIKLLTQREADVGDTTTMTVSRDSVGGLLTTVSSRYKKYRLEKRADHIPFPAEWTKVSFEEYIADLVYGQVPTHLVRKLYPTGPTHQETVVSLLLAAFGLEQARSAITVSALKLALGYIQSKELAFRPASRALFHQAELLHLPLDTEVFNAFLVGASRVGDLDGFNSIIRTMVRKGVYPHSHSWLAFLDMIKVPKVKRYIINKMRARGLNRLPSVLTVMGRHMALIDLEHSLSDASADFDAQLFVEEHDKKYGIEWLDTITLNKILDILGNHEKLEACQGLLESIHATGRTVPDTYTLNTMIHHSRKIQRKIDIIRSMEARWPTVRLNDVTYHEMFQVAWKQRLPNMLRVIWRYALLVRATTPKMRTSLVELVRQERGLSKQRALLKAWEDVIFGQAELKEMQKVQPPEDLRRTHMVEIYLKVLQDMRAREKLSAKLQEAYDMDMEIHRLIKEGTVMTTSMRESLSVDIPLVIKRLSES